MAGVGNLGAGRSGLSRSKSSLGGPSESKEAVKDRKRHMKHVECAKDLVEQYDENGSGKLSREEVRNLLIDLSDGTAVTEDELDFVFKVADANSDKAISALEMSTLLNCWDNYQAYKKEIEGHFKKHDPQGTGRLKREQLKGLLEEKSDGGPVYDEDVEWILRESSRLKLDAITKPELRRVLALWECRNKAKANSQSCCTLQ